MTPTAEPACWDLLKPIDGSENEKDLPKGEGGDEDGSSCYSTPECCIVGSVRYLEPDLKSNCFIGSEL